MDPLGLCGWGVNGPFAPDTSNLDYVGTAKVMGTIAGSLTGIGLIRTLAVAYPGLYVGGIAALDETGVIAGSATLQRLLAAGAAIRAGERGLSQAGRALQKHGGRTGSSFPSPSGTNCEINKQAQNILEEVLSAKDLGIEIWKNGSRLYRNPSTGRGAKFKADGTFEGFLDPRF